MLILYEALKNVTEILTDYKADGEPKLLFQNPLKQQQQTPFWLVLQFSYIILPWKQNVMV